MQSWVPVLQRIVIFWTDWFHSVAPDLENVLHSIWLTGRGQRGHTSNCDHLHHESLHFQSQQWFEWRQWYLIGLWFWCVFFYVQSSVLKIDCNFLLFRCYCITCYTNMNIVGRLRCIFLALHNMRIWSVSLKRIGEGVCKSQVEMRRLTQPFKPIKRSKQVTAVEGTRGHFEVSWVKV